MKTYTESQIKEALYNAKCGGVPIELYTTEEEIERICDNYFFPEEEEAQNERSLFKMKKILHDDYGNRAEIEKVVTLPYKDSPKKRTRLQTFALC